jgi:capsular exopolysaccharide synthesis family protein
MPVSSRDDVYMSRFYDALTRAQPDHSIPDADSVLQEVVSDARSRSGSSVVVLPEEGTPGIGSGTVGGDLPFTSTAPRRLPDTETPQHHTPGGRRIRICLDKRARLLPNATDAAVVEHYRRLRTRLVQEQTANAYRSLMVTSPNPQEGKSVTVLNLALSFAMIPSLSVVVIDADLRRGSLSKWLGVSGEEPGFSDLLQGTATLDDVVLRGEELPLAFIVSGRSERAPGELLLSEHVRSQIGKLTESFDLVLVDSPPVNVITDAQLIAGGCDAILMVARAFSTTCKQLEKAVQDLHGFRLLGTVLNAGTSVKHYGGYNGYY